MTRVNIFYSGSVQGVGFRFTVLAFSTGLNLEGWVKNLSDGRVQILAEGKRKDIEQWMEAIESRFSGHIREKKIFFEDPKGNLVAFHVAY